MSEFTMNKVTLIGRIGKDVVSKQLKNGQDYCQLALATNETYKDKNTNQYVTNTIWHNVRVFGRSAAFCGQYVKKGARVCVEGRLKMSQYEKDGQTIYDYYVNVDSVDVLDYGKNSQPQQAQAQTQERFEPASMPANDECPF